jgi:hypothetical protein
LPMELAIELIDQAQKANLDQILIAQFYACHITPHHCWIDLLPFGTIKVLRRLAQDFGDRGLLTKLEF